MDVTPSASKVRTDAATRPRAQGKASPGSRGGPTLAVRRSGADAAQWSVRAVGPPHRPRRRIAIEDAED